MVVESDDWGAERVSDRRTQDLLRELPGFKDGPHSRVDTLESPEDYDALLSCLSELEQQTGKKVKMTLNFLAGNPDYASIRESKFSQYYLEPFTTTYTNKHQSNQGFQLLKEGMERGYFQAQFHGREHVWVNPWLEELSNENSSFRKAFDLNNFGADLGFSKNGINIQEAWNLRNEADKIHLEQSIQEGLFYFKKIFGFLPSTSVAPRHVWGGDAEQALMKAGISGMQSSPYRQKTLVEAGGSEALFTGGKSQAGMYLLCRNAWFETAYAEKDWVGEVMKKARLAFFLGNPLIICSHRLNFSGGLSEANRKNTLHQLKALVAALTKTWPDIEFVSSDQLLNRLQTS
ncbi:hypothetical protein MASR2M44_14270 [Bacteroidota bacterium]